MFQSFLIVVSSGMREPIFWVYDMNEYSVFVGCTFRRELRKDGQRLRPKHVGALINQSIVQQVGVKFYTCNIYNKMLHLEHGFVWC